MARAGTTAIVALPASARARLEQCLDELVEQFDALKFTDHRRGELATLIRAVEAQLDAAEVGNA